MAYEPFLIAPYDNSGLKKWYKPWLIGQTAFPAMLNAYARRGVVRKREGYRSLAPLPSSDKPVMGLKNWVNPSTLGNDLIAFSRTKSYLFNDITQVFNDVTFRVGGGAFSFTNGTNDYFWTSNYAGSMWTTNNLTADGINYWNLSNNWSNFNPTLNGGGTTLGTCLIILPYKGRLVCLNTTENGTNIPNRARFSQIGTPYVLNDATHAPAPGFGVDANAWREDIPGKGGYIDADTSERIVSAGIIRDTLIVFFQRSTWRLTYTGNEILPYIWERLNTQYGSEATYSTIEFDDAALTFSRFGWIASSTNDVGRIDLDIPDDSFAVEGTSTDIVGLRKIQGIRDFYRNFAYFTYIPIAQSDATQIYAYNYIDKSWTIFEPTVPINVFGTYRNTAGDFTWAKLNTTEDTWQNYNSPDSTWSDLGSGQNEDFPYIVGGDLNGNVYQMFEFFQIPTLDNGSRYNFSVSTKRDNPYISKGSRAKLGYVDLYCTTFPGGQITLKHFIDDHQEPVMTKEVNLYEGGVENITNISIGATTTITTQEDHDLIVGQFVKITDVNGTVQEVLNDQYFKVGTIPTTKTFTITDQAGNNINTTGYTYIGQGYTWNEINVEGDSSYIRVFLGSTGRMHQIELTLSDRQLADKVKGAAQFEMQGMVLWFRELGRIKR